MFSKRDHLWFSLSLLALTMAYILMVVDPVEYGFGFLTLWIAPPLLLGGFFLPVIGITGFRFKQCSRVLSNMSAPYRHIVGAGVFAIALCTYGITLEPTASLWDCSEFIASAHKLQVPHSPGNPLFLLFGRLFSMLVLDDVTMVALAINFMSALFSAATVFIVYHLIYYFSARTEGSDGSTNILSIVAATSGSLCLTFSDTFWFSAVEAETYAAASFFLMLVVWLIVRGADLPDEKRARRIVLIFYLAGLSYCIHPMCLLALPLLPILWFVSDGSSRKTYLFALAVGLTIVIGINRMVAVGFFELMFSFDLFFVNILGFPFYTGAFVLFASSILAFVLLLRRFKDFRPYIWAIVFLLAGFLPYALLFIRSNHNPPIDETNPENLALIKAYMNRESYGSTPLLYGPYFDASIEGVSINRKMYYRDTSAYQVAGTTSAYEYDKSRQTILPRMYSNDEDHITAYRSWTGLKDNEQPSFRDNVSFMLRFQLGEMYFRYLLFNFAGRKSDAQYSGWLKPWESVQGPVPEKARNQYWMVPLMIGFAGVCYQYSESKKDFFALAIFFLVTGALLAVYLNAPPNEPRERDYIYVGSFIVYCIWIGIGVTAIGSFGAKYKGSLYPLVFVSFAVPVWMCWQNFDDHNRRGRTFQIDNARNLLQSCAPNSILFTGGDNDTFPLWYLQEVEGFRTDVRVMVLSYLNTDWYINQLRRTYYKSPAFNLSLDKRDYQQYGPNDVLYIHESIKDDIDGNKYLQLLHDEHPALRMYSANHEPYSILPSRSLKLHIGNHDLSVQVKGNFLPKNALAVIDLLISNGWSRPVYFNFTSYNQIELNIDRYLVQEGLVYRFTPVESPSKAILPDTDLMYKNLVERSNYENLARPEIYFNYEDFQARMVEPLRSAFNVLAIGLLNEGKEKRAVSVMDQAIQLLYTPHLKPSFSNLQAADIFLHLGNATVAEKLSAAVFDYAYLEVEESVTNDQQIEQLPLFLLQRSSDLLNRLGRTDYPAKVDALL